MKTTMTKFLSKPGKRLQTNWNWNGRCSLCNYSGVKKLGSWHFAPTEARTKFAQSKYIDNFWQQWTWPVRNWKGTGIKIFKTTERIYFCIPKYRQILESWIEWSLKEYQLVSDGHLPKSLVEEHILLLRVDLRDTNLTNGLFDFGFKLLIFGLFRLKWTRTSGPVVIMKRVNLDILRNICTVLTFVRLKLKLSSKR